MRRIVSIILAAALFCLTLTACGSRQKTDLSGAKTIADLKGATIAAQAGTFHLDAVDQIEDVDKKSYPDFTDLLNALKSGAIDGYVAEEPTALEVCGKDDTLTYLPFVNNDTGFTATDAETGIAVAFQTGSSMVATVNDILATIPTETRQALMAQMVSLTRTPTPGRRRSNCAAVFQHRHLQRHAPHRDGMRLRPLQLDADDRCQRRRPHLRQG